MFGGATCFCFGQARVSQQWEKFTFEFSHTHTRLISFTLLASPLHSHIPQIPSTITLPCTQNQLRPIHDEPRIILPPPGQRPHSPSAAGSLCQGWAGFHAKGKKNSQVPRLQVEGIEAHICTNHMLLLNLFYRMTISKERCKSIGMKTIRRSDSHCTSMTCMRQTRRPMAQI